MGTDTGLRVGRGRRLVPSPGGPAPATAKDGRLGYIADMARQLELMSANMGCRTLAALLELARQEALVQRQAGRKPASGRV